VTTDREDEKRFYERRALDAFLKVCGHSHEPPEDGRPGQEPDFLVTFATGRVGIEVTNDIWEWRRAIEESRIKIVARAERIYAAQDRTPLHVAIDWADEAVHPVEPVAQKIAAVVRSAAPNREKGETIVDDEPLYAAGLAFLSWIRITRNPVLTKNDWCVPDAGGVRVLGPDRIREVIEKKEEKHGTFLAGAEGWLLLYTFDERVSGSSEISDEAQNAVYRTRFSRVFALNVPSEKLVQFRVE
jgi:hypothetical protein